MGKGSFSRHSLAASVAAVCHGFFYTPYRTGLTAARGADTGALVVPVSSDESGKRFRYKVDVVDTA